ncbi:hypothetical protein CBA19CS22_34605 [Caballeronia novacaledonica]|uniref:Uncharacterized protein n=1 Tax=Caballeronia novacaledonica TaxID=1544861 RepID=A0ACB5R337_9BURK|nr:hypothetical protein CBA19CS22_34605 [Caballeronia novacaledonica]
MLKLETDRLDYGDQLRAPDGYRLHSALTTTYSLDLETLAAASLALTLDQVIKEDDEAELSGERLALLEALDRLQNRLLVFHQRGNIKVPEKFNRLFALLEPLIAPVIALEGAAGAFASFHPKMWLLRFEPDEADAPDRWRLLVLSRNLTFDRSWDVAASLDGQSGGRRPNGDKRLVDFLRSLSRDPAHAAFIEGMCEGLESVAWTAPDPFDAEVAILPGRHGDAHWPSATPFALDEVIEEKFDDLLVVSPFVDAGEHSMLDALASRMRASGSRTLISRGDTLDKIGPERLKDWNVLSLSERVVDGEESNEEKTPALQNLHAKLIVVRQQGMVAWHMGSANMTNAAFGQPGANVHPRNCELMVRLTGRNQKVGPAKLLDMWSAANVFQPHTFKEAASDAAEREQRIRQIVHALRTAAWRLHAEETEPAHFDMRLEVTPFEPQPGFDISVRMLCRADERALAPAVSWSNVSLTDVSAFVSVEVRAADTQCERFVIQAAFSADLLEARKRAIFRDVIGNGEKLLRYLALVLDTDPSRGDWTRADGDGKSVDIFGLDGRGALYEQLLRAASRAPRRMSRAIEIFERIRHELDALPEGLDTLFDGFARYHGSKQ